MEPSATSWSMDVIHPLIPKQLLQQQQQQQRYSNDDSSSINIHEELVVVTAAVANPPWYCIVTKQQQEGVSTPSTASSFNDNKYTVKLYYEHHTGGSSFIQQQQLLLSPMNRGDTTTTSSSSKRFKRSTPTRGSRFSSTTIQQQQQQQQQQNNAGDPTSSNVVNATKAWYSCTLEVPESALLSADASSSSSSTVTPFLGMLVSPNTTTSTTTNATTTPTTSSSSSSTNMISKCMIYLLEPDQNLLYYYKVSSEQIMMMMTKTNTMIQQTPLQQQQQQTTAIVQPTTSIRIGIESYNHMNYDGTKSISSSSSSHITNPASTTTITSFVVQLSSSSNSSSSSSSSSSSNDAITSPFIMVGCSNGALYKIQQIHIPTISFQCIPLFNNYHNSNSHTVSSSNSIFQRFFPSSLISTNNFASSSSSLQRHDMHGTTNHASSIISIHLLQTSSVLNSMMTITKIGRIQFWSTTTKSSSQSTSNSSSSIHHWKLYHEISLLEHVSPPTNNNNTTASMEVLRSCVLLESPSLRSKSNSNITTSSAILHCVVRIMDPSYATMETTTTTNDYRLYWISMVLQLSTSAQTTSVSPVESTIKVTWLNRFVRPFHVSICDMCIANDRIVYGIFVEESSSITNINTIPSTTTIMACLDRNETATGTSKQHQIVEMDVPITTAQQYHPHTTIMNMISSIVPNSASSENIVTYGINLFDTLGSYIRIRYLNAIQNDETETTTGDVLHDEAMNMKNNQDIHTLSLHLHSVFRSMLQQRQQEDDTTTSSIPTMIQLPPSIQNSTKHNLERAVELCANQLYVFTTQLKNKNTAANRIEFFMYQSYNELDLHIMFITMLQQSGIYRSLSLLCKWKLLCVGQMIAVWQAFNTLFQQSKITTTGSSQWEIECYYRLISSESNNPPSLDEWMGRLQKDIFGNNGNYGEDRYGTYISWLVLALSAAASYRTERVVTLYDVTPNQLPIVQQIDHVPVWTTKPIIRHLLHHIVDYWKVNSSTFSTTTENVEFIIQQYVLSCSDCNESCPNTETRSNYILATRKSCQVMRSMCNRDDALANDGFIFDLCITHRFFREICQIAYDHEHRRDCTEYSLEPLLQSLPFKEDIETGMVFTLYVIKWHADRKYYGQVMKYGKICPIELNQLMNNDESLKPCHWIQAIRQGNFNTAIESLYSISKLTAVTFQDVATSLRIARMSSSIVEAESISPSVRESALCRRRLIDKKLELVNVQRTLMSDTTTSNSDFTKLWTADQLLHLAIQKAHQYSDIENKISTLLLGLATCTTLNDTNEKQENALTFWMNVIAFDLDFWNEYSNGQSDILFKSMHSVIRDKTVFGKLLNQVEGIDEWTEVSYTALNDDIIHTRIGEMYPQLFDNGLHRLLRIAARSV